MTRLQSAPDFTVLLPLLPVLPLPHLFLPELPLQVLLQLHQWLQLPYSVLQSYLQ